jgi:hypothetical protein
MGGVVVSDRKENEMRWFNWLKGKSRAPVADVTKVAPPKTGKAEPQKKEHDDPQQILWRAESSSAMRSIITSMTEQDLTDLVGTIAFVDFPLNALASPGGALDKRSTLTAHFTLQLLKAGKNPQANHLLNKILNKMQIKLAKRASEQSIGSQGWKPAFESAFAAGDMGSATEILKQNTSTDFWRIDEMLKKELFDLSMEMLKKDRPKEAAILLDAVMLDYQKDLDTEFWRAAAYHNIFNNDRSDSQAKDKAKQAVNTFLTKAGEKPQFMKQCADLRNLTSDY